MPINLDHIGLNTLIQEPVTASQNTIGLNTHIVNRKILKTPSTNLGTIHAGLNIETYLTDNTLNGGDYTTLTSTGTMTISFWAKFNSDYINGDRKYAFLLNYGPSFETFTVFYLSGDLVIIATGTGGSSLYRITHTPTPNVWTHYIVSINTSDLTNDPLVYIDGQEQSFLYSSPGSGTLYPFSGINIMGYFKETSNKYQLQGTMKELAILNFTPNSLQIDELLNKTDLRETSFASNIVNYWRLGLESTLQSFSDAQIVKSETEVKSVIGDITFFVKSGVSISTESYENTSQAYINYYVGMLKDNDYLAALNIHRNGPYGWPIFKQTRIGQNPLTRYQNRNSIFTYVTEIGDVKLLKQDGKLIDTIRERRSNLRQIIESPVVSNYKPLTLIGSTEVESIRGGRLSKQRIEVKTTYANETTYFGDDQTTREHGVELETVEDYEDFVDLYLDGGLDSDDSPFDEFEMLRFDQTVYPRAGNTYLDQVRGRPNFNSGYWRDDRNDRTKTGTIDNGFGFNIPSQSIWPLDVEEGWKDRTINATLGYFTASSPYNWNWDTTPANASGLFFASGSSRIYTRDADGVSPGSDTDNDFDSAPGSGYYIDGEKYSLNTVRGHQVFWSKIKQSLGGYGLLPGNNGGFYGTTTITTSSAYVTPSDHDDNYKLEVSMSSAELTDLKEHLTGSFTFHCRQIGLGSDEQGALVTNGGKYFSMYNGNDEICRFAKSGNYLNIRQAAIFEQWGWRGQQGYYTSSMSEGYYNALYSIPSEINNSRGWNSIVANFKQDKDFDNQIFINGTEIGIGLELDEYDVKGELHNVTLDSSSSYGYKLNSTADCSWNTSDISNLTSNLTTYAPEILGFSFSLGFGSKPSGNNTGFQLIGFYEDMVNQWYRSFYINLLTTTDSTAWCSMEIWHWANNVTYKRWVFKIPIALANKKVKFHLSLDNRDSYYTDTKLYYWNESTNSYSTISPYQTGKTGIFNMFYFANMQELYILTQNVRGPNTAYRQVLDVSLIEFAMWEGTKTSSDNAQGARFGALKYFNSGSVLDLTSSYAVTTQGFGNELRLWYRFGDSTEDDLNGTSHNIGYPNDFQGDILYDYAYGTHLTASRDESWVLTAGLETNYLKPLRFALTEFDKIYVLADGDLNYISSGDTRIAEVAFISGAYDLSDAQDVADSTDGIYEYINLTSSSLTAQTASLLYRFTSSTDHISDSDSYIENLSTGFASGYHLSSSYSSAPTNIGEVDGEGMVIDGTREFLYYANNLANQDLQENKSTYSVLGTIESSEIQGNTSNLYVGGASGYNAEGAPGFLMNSYNQFNAEPYDSAVSIDSQYTSSCLYTRRNSLATGSSFYNPHGMHFSASSVSSIYHNRDKLAVYEIYQGMAAWDAPSQSGKKPFYDSYNQFAEEVRMLGKDYSVIPEYKISSHVEKFLVSGDTEFKTTDNPLLEITGGELGKSNSDNEGFYTTYSTTEFLKHFDIIQEDHKGFVDPLSITLKCKAVKKFLPYKGFYPADRTVEIAQQFYASYGDNLRFTSSNTVSTNPQYAAQNLLTPLFSPGILFNTIKSGIACDYPLITTDLVTSSIDIGDGVTTSYTGSYYINQQFDTRIPFEALIEPEKYLANISLTSNEPDPNGNVGTSVIWNGQGDEKYRLMVSNFLAETGDFFLKNKNYSTIASLPEGDPNFGNAQAGKTYMMRLRMYRSISGSKDIWVDDGGSYVDPQPQGDFGVPQDTGSMSESITMYSRPSGFGPPQRLTLSGSHGTSVYLNFSQWAEYKYPGSIDTFYHTASDLNIIYSNSPNTPSNTSVFRDLQVDSDGHFLKGNDASEGYNYPFTPPYYHGEAWADIIFKPTETKKYTLSEIINSSSVEFLRYYEPMEEAVHAAGEHFHTNWRLINEDAMQLASSVNLFSKGVLKQDITQTKRKGIRNDVQVQVDTNVANSYRWIIQSKYETPVLNFNHIAFQENQIGLSSSVAMTIPNIAPETTPVGMWHQYGEIPQDPKQGIFLQVADVPKRWIENAMGGTGFLTSSLADLCGFSTNPVKVGELAQTKRVYEAIVAVPYVQENNEKRFYNISRTDIDNALEPSTQNLVGETLVNMVRKIKKYNLPPSMDFISNPDIEPFAMYVFEFSHTFSKQELADMWQNLQPEIGTSHEEVESTISHELLFHELLGSKAKTKPGINTDRILDRQARLNEINPNLQWLVFKVKQRGKNNYFEKIYKRNESQEQASQDLGVTSTSTGKKSNIGYNWPYDFFSLVELAKIDAQIDFANADDQNQEEKLVIKPRKKIKQVDRTPTENEAAINNALFGTGTPLTSPAQTGVQQPLEPNPLGNITRRRKK